MAKKEKRKRKNTAQSLMVRTWAYFVGMTVIMLTILWVTALIVFRGYYTSLRENSLVTQCSALSRLYNGVATEDFKNEVESAVAQNTMRVTVFTIDGDKSASELTEQDITVTLNVDPIDGVGDSEGVVSFLLKLDEKFVEKIQADSKIHTYHLRNRHSAGANGYNLVVGCSKQTANGKAYILITSPVQANNTMDSIVINQLLIVTILCVVISVSLSYVFSKNITKPITQYASVARRMGNGEKVRFGEVGFIEYDDLARALNHATEEIEKTENQRREFMANVGHDLRTPLTMVKAYAEMIRDLSGRDEKKRTEHCGVIIDEVDRLTLLVNDILDLSKLQSGTRVPEYATVNLSETVGNVLDRFAIYREKHGYVFNLDVQSDCVTQCDERMIEQVLYNLIGNAISYTGEDKTVSVTLAKRDGEIVFAVTDTGKGISPEETDKVWERYYRVNQEKRTVVGSGMGLSIVKNILDLHKAEYGVKSVVGKGSTFYFKLTSKS
ncbi:MAG: HAMP domain-containing histidine kinase [Clostridia bacterium]|nr:HAMP domain-containing histidine kinase [Clostridia bacterium]